jgi:hypothetical protein
MKATSKALRSELEQFVKPLAHLWVTNRRQDNLINFQKAIMKAQLFQVEFLLRTVKDYAREIKRLRRQLKKQRK